MSDDIVARLRNKHADDPLAWEVADEIERLREALERQRFQTISAQMDADALKLLLKKAGRK